MCAGLHEVVGDTTAGMRELDSEPLLCIDGGTRCLRSPHRCTCTLAARVHDTHDLEQACDYRRRRYRMAKLTTVITIWRFLLPLTVAC